MKQLILIIIPVFLGLSCLNHKYSDMEKEKIIYGILLSSATGSTATAVSCTTNYTFSSLGSSAGLTSKCASFHFFIWFRRNRD